MFVMRLAEELHSQGHDIYVYNHQPEWSNKKFLSSFSGKIKVFSYSKNPFIIFMTWKINGLVSKFDKNFNFRDRFSRWSFRRIIRKYKFDVINSQSVGSDLITSVVAPEMRVPFVITNHGEYEMYLDGKKKNFEQDATKTLSLAESVIYTAEKNIEAIRPLLQTGKPVRKISIGFNGDVIKRYTVDIDSLGIGDNDFVIGMLARGIPEKGWEEAIKMFSLLKSEKLSRKIHFVMIGNGEQLKELFERNKMDGLHLLQSFTNTMEYFSWLSFFDAGILLTHFKGESVPNAIIEYLYHGLPVLATPIGDISHMISSPDGMAGEIVEIKDGKADFKMAATIIKRWIEEPEYLELLKRNTKEAFTKFDMKFIASEYLEVYNKAIVSYQSRHHSA